MLKWERLAPLLVALRGWVLSLAGFAALTISGFLWHPIAGFAVLGACLLVTEALTRPGEETAS